MKKLHLILLLIAGSIIAKANIKSDTTIVEFTDKGVKKRVTVYTSGKKEFDLPKVLNLDNVLKSIGVDSLERKKAIILAGNDGEKQDTILVFAQDGRSIKIVARMPKEMSSRRDSRQDTLRNENNGDHWSREEKNNENYEKNDDDYEHKDNSYNDKEKLNKKTKNQGRFFSRSDFGMYLGLNNWTKNPSNASSLDTWGSRYVALSLQKNATLINGKQVDLAFTYGPEIAWNNFMFEENNVIDMAGKQVVFKDFGENLKKTKLVVPMINFPMMFNLGFEEAKFKIGFGGYIGYRVRSYRKLQYEDGQKIKAKGSYGLNDFRYGLTAELGKRKGLTFFFRYDLSEMFKVEQKNAAGLQAWSVGLRL